MSDKPTENPQHRSSRPPHSLDPHDRRVRARYGIWGLASDSSVSESDPTLEGEAPDLENKDLEHLGLFFYLIPVVGFFPALWTLYRQKGSRTQKTASRLAVTLALGWLIGYVLLETGARSTELFAVPLLLLSSLLTSSYFVVNIWLMIRLWQRRPLRLPWVTRIADRAIGKHLS
ncbi:hypothetical protein [Phormidium sp. CCY1219]|uniref:hypothetical protein n=1 Tax=Phormidium sp. CCY1219 TaxID=2886104 RepID=UPI002D7915E2|nr:hypothetical protein [Phormidium sp. CCY1219]